MLDSVKHTVRFYVYIHFLSTVQHRSITVPVSSTAGIVPRPTVPPIKYPLSISKPSVIVRTTEYSVFVFSDIETTVASKAFMPKSLTIRIEQEMAVNRIAKHNMMILTIIESLKACSGESRPQNRSMLGPQISE